MTDWVLSQALSGEFITELFVARFIAKILVRVFRRGEARRRLAELVQREPARVARRGMLGVRMSARQSNVVADSAGIVASEQRLDFRHDEILSSMLVYIQKKKPVDPRNRHVIPRSASRLLPWSFGSEDRCCPYPGGAVTQSERGFCSGGRRLAVIFQVMMIPRPTAMVDVGLNSNLESCQGG